MSPSNVADAILYTGGYGSKEEVERFLKYQTPIVIHVDVTTVARNKSLRIAHGEQGEVLLVKQRNWLIKHIDGKLSSCPEHAFSKPGSPSYQTDSVTGFHQPAPARPAPVGGRTIIDAVLWDGSHSGSYTFNQIVNLIKWVTPHTLGSDLTVTQTNQALRLALSCGKVMLIQKDSWLIKHSDGTYTSCPKNLYSKPGSPTWQAPAPCQQATPQTPCASKQVLDAVLWNGPDYYGHMPTNVRNLLTQSFPSVQADLSIAQDSQALRIGIQSGSQIGMVILAPKRNWIIKHTDGTIATLPEDKYSLPAGMAAPTPVAPRSCPSAMDECCQATDGADLTGEIWRAYLFNGRTTGYVINNPKKLFVREGGTTHKILDSAGIVHCVPAPGHQGCTVTWLPRDHRNPCQF